MRGVELTLRGEMDDEFARGVPDPYRVWGYLTKAGPNSKRGIPHALYFRDAREVSLRDVRVRWGEVSGPWRSALRCERVEGLDAAGCSLGAAPGPAKAPAVHLTDVRGAALRDCRAGRDGGEFLRADGESSEVSPGGCEALSVLLAEPDRRLAGRGLCRVEWPLDRPRNRRTRRWPCQSRPIHPRRSARRVAN